MRHEPQTRPEEPRHRKIVAFLRGYVPELVAGSFLLAAVVVYFGFDVTIPRFWYVFSLAAIAVSPLGFFVGQKVTSWLYDPSWIYLIDLDARVLEGGIFRCWQSGSPTGDSSQGTAR